MQRWFKRHVNSRNEQDDGIGDLTVTLRLRDLASLTAMIASSAVLGAAMAHELTDAEQQEALSHDGVQLDAWAKEVTHSALSATRDSPTAPQISEDLLEVLAEESFRQGFRNWCEDADKLS